MLHKLILFSHGVCVCVYNGDAHFITEIFFVEMVMFIYCSSTNEILVCSKIRTANK
ncbi:hypothetical protein JHK86_027709 [Glycine max]|nr:hypothetical protein JHK86_027709 [Glycine max]